MLSFFPHTAEPHKGEPHTAGTAYSGKLSFFPHTAETAYSEGVGVCNVAMRPSLQSGGIRPASYLGQV